MLRVVGYESHSNTEYCGWNASGSRPALLVVDLRDSGRNVRAPSDFIENGGVFDRFGNKAVSHQQWRGTLYPRFSGGSESRDSTDQFFQTVRVNRRWYTVITPTYPYIYVRNKTATTVSIQFFWADRVHGRPVCPLTDFTIKWSREAMSGVLKTVAKISAASFQMSPAVSGDYGSANAYCQRLRSIYWIVDRYPSSSDEALEFALGKLRTFGQALSTFACSGLAATGVDWPIQGVFTPKFDPVDVRGALNHLDFLRVENRHRWTTSELSSGAAEIIDQYDDFSSNGLAYLSDIQKAGDTVRSVLQLSRGIDIKSLANVWLSGRFGDRLTISDTRELISSVQRAMKVQPYRISRSTLRYTGTTPIYHFPLACERRSTVITEPGKSHDLVTAIDSLMRWDIWPTLGNTWDMIPLSFVVDWFLSVSDILDQIDAAVRAPYLRPVSQYASDKFVMRANVSTSGLIGAAEHVRYSRGSYPVLSDIRPFERTSSVPSFGVTNVIDAGALLVQLVG